MSMRLPLATTGLALALMIGGCGGEESRGGLSAEEERQLDNAAAMLDENTLTVPDDSLAANEADLLEEEPDEVDAGNGSSQ